MRWIVEKYGNQIVPYVLESKTVFYNQRFYTANVRYVRAYTFPLRSYEHLKINMWRHNNFWKVLSFKQLQLNQNIAGLTRLVFSRANLMIFVLNLEKFFVVFQLQQVKKEMYGKRRKQYNPRCQVCGCSRIKHSHFLT